MTDLPRSEKLHTFLPAIAAVLCVLIAGGIWFFFSHGGAKAPEEIVSPIPLSGEVDPAALAEAAPPPEGYVQYTNTRYGFSFYHSPEGKITEYDEGGGAMTVTLENFDKVRGMQIFIVPYSGDTISEQRFHDDVPSGVRDDTQMTTVGAKKIPAVTFRSQDATLGPTRELWFIYGGHLYEVTTFQGVKDWLTPIIQSWRFTK